MKESRYLTISKFNKFSKQMRSEIEGLKNRIRSLSNVTASGEDFKFPKETGDDNDLHVKFEEENVKVIDKGPFMRWYRTDSQICLEKWNPDIRMSGRYRVKISFEADGPITILKWWTIDGELSGEIHEGPLQDS